MNADTIIDPFIITEDFSQIFGGLIGVYSRLTTKEKMRDTYLRNGNRLVKWQKRVQEMIMIKSALEEKTMKEMQSYNDIYRHELIEMIDMENILILTGEHI